VCESVHAAASAYGWLLLLSHWVPTFLIYFGRLERGQVEFSEKKKNPFPV
jgi:hypothetical protein